jgi:3-isopropylmalate/(R)-2-methylmalate dehydratase small subunit
VSDGDVLTVDVPAGTFRNETTGAERQVPPPDGFLLEMLRAGGLIALAKGRRDLFDPETSFRDASRTAAPRPSVMPDQ